MRGRKKNPLKVTSFRLPEHVMAFLKARAVEQRRTMSFILIDIVQLYIDYETKKAEQPKKPVKEPVA